MHNSARRVLSPVITFLAVPVIALEGTGPIATLKRSAGLFRSRWGQQVTGNISMLVSSALSNIFGVALYRYALEGQAIGAFTAEELESAVKPRGGHNAPPTATPGTI